MRSCFYPGKSPDRDTRLHATAAHHFADLDTLPRTFQAPTTCVMRSRVATNSDQSGMARVRSDTAASSAQPDEKSAPGLWLYSESRESEAEDGEDEEGSCGSNLGLSWPLREVICQSCPSYKYRTLFPRCSWVSSRLVLLPVQP